MTTPSTLPDRIRALDISIGDNPGAGQLLKSSIYEFRYLDPSPAQPAAALLMPASSRLTWQDGDPFAPMDQAGRHQTRAYPTQAELLDFGRRVCGVAQPLQVLQQIAQAMHETMAHAAGDERVPPTLLHKMRAAWTEGIALAG